MWFNSYEHLLTDHGQTVGPGDGRAHTAIIMQSLNTCYTGTVEIIGEYILEQSVSVRAVPEFKIVWARRGR